jgi:hypothetical protein
MNRAWSIAGKNFLKQTYARVNMNGYDGKANLLWGNNDRSHTTRDTLVIVKGCSMLVPYEAMRSLNLCAKVQS